MFRRRNVVLNSILIIALLVIGFFGYQAVFPKTVVAAIRTATASVGNVVTTVSASGSVQASTDIGLIFKTSGIVRTLNVKVGDKVSKGQVLATIDDAAASLALLQAEATYKTSQVSILQSQQTIATADQGILTAQNSLDTLLAGPTDSVKKSQATAIVQQNSAIDAAQQALDNAISAQALQDTTTVTNLAGYDRTIERARFDLNAKCGCTVDDAHWNGVDWTQYTTTRPAALALTDALLAKQAGILKDATATQAAANAVVSAKRALASAQLSLETLKQTQADANQNPTDLAIATAKATLAKAKRDKDIAVIQVAQTDAAVATSKAALLNAQQNLDGTKIIAPSAGTVAAIASPVGVNAGSTTAGGGGVAGYIIITDLSSLQISASVAEADIVNLAVGQVATYSFDALASAQATGSVISVAPINNASTGSGTVMSYTVLFSLDAIPAGVKPGMTAQVSVTTAQATGVLSVPSSAVTQRGGRFTVTLKPKVVGGVGTRVPVQVGLQGDSLTEIQSGLKAGDEVVLRTVVSSSASTGFPAGGIPGGAPVVVGNFGGGGGGGRNGG